MRGARYFLLLGAVALSAGLAPAATPSPASMPQGYLTPGEFDVTHILEPAPRKGDPRYESDRKIFRATRALRGTPRWDLATKDAALSPKDMLRDYSCAVGISMTPANTHAISTVLQRASMDTLRQMSRAKEYYKRSRPYFIDRGEICQPRAELGHSYDYPSGHTTWGWTWGLILASLAPDRAQPILERARAYGDSRFICGAHNESAVEAGKLAASATMALVQTKPAYQADLAAACAEMDALRADPATPRPDHCEAEAALVNERVMPKLDATRRH